MIYIYIFINVWLILNLTNCRKIQATLPSSKSKRHEAPPPFLPFPPSLIIIMQCLIIETLTLAGDD